MNQKKEVVLLKIISRVFRNTNKTATTEPCKRNKKWLFQIEEQIICEENNGILFKLKENRSGIAVVKSAKEILFDKKILQNISSEDALQIGYVMGCDSVINENNFKKTNSNTNGKKSL
jgi:hypothetical protein